MDELEKSAHSAILAARKALGNDASAGRQGLNTRHTGKVISVSEHHFVQESGTKTFVLHRKCDVKGEIEKDRTVTIQYIDGKGTVLAPKRELSHEKSLKKSKTTEISR